jgi:hypothetical protein
MKNLEVTTESGEKFKVLFSTNRNSPMPFHVSGGILNADKIWNKFEDNQKVNVEKIGFVTIKKVQPTFLTEGKLYINI